MSAPSRFLFSSLLWMSVFAQMACAQLGTDARTAEDIALTERMRDASVPEIKAFIREVLDEPLPEGYEIPQYIIDAGDPDAATAAVGARFPEFFGKEGPEYIRSVAEHPVRYRQLIRESRALRKQYQDAISEN